jgi:hypothetical protein
MPCSHVEVHLQRRRIILASFLLGCLFDRVEGGSTFSLRLDYSAKCSDFFV